MLAIKHNKVTILNMVGETENAENFEFCHHKLFSRMNLAG